MTVIRNRVVRRAHAQTRDRTEEVAAEHKHIFLGRGFVPGREGGVDGKGSNEGEHGADEVGVDVYGFVVQVAEGLEGFEVRVGRGAVAGENVVIVLQPVGELVPEDGKAGFYCLFGLGEGIGGFFDGLHGAGPGPQDSQFMGECVQRLHGIGVGVVSREGNSWQTRKAKRRPRHQEMD